MYSYQIIIQWSEEDKAFLAIAPELPGCMADGKTRQEAIQNIERVIEEWIEIALEDGEEIPKPVEQLLYV